MPDLVLHEVAKHYGSGAATTTALDGVSLHIRAGEFVAVVGPSGSGKSTLLNMISCLDTPSSGYVQIDDTVVNTLPDRKTARLRSATFGFVFQSFHLMGALTLRENVELGLLYRGMRRTEVRQRARQALRAVGLAERENELARNLSGGQRQRVAIARALVGDAPVIVADEPTGNLDRRNSRAILDLLASLAGGGRTILLVTHDSEIAAAADRIITVDDGRITADVATSQHASHHNADDPQHPTGIPGTPSRLRLPDLLRDALLGLAAHRGRAVAAICAVMLGIALVTATLGIGYSARAQVAETFDTQRNVQVGASVPDFGADRSLEDLERTVRSLAGVEEAGAATTEDDALLVHQGETLPTGTLTFRMTPGFSAATRQEIRWGGAPHTLDAHEMLIGSVLASELGLAPLFTAPTIRLNGQEFTVVGVIENAPLTPDILRSVAVASTAEIGINPLLPADDDPGPRDSASVRAITAPGAAQQVGKQLPLALDAKHPEEIVVDAPPDPSTSRVSIESTVTLTLQILAGVAVLISAVFLIVSLTLSVVQRRGELGLRRALGAARRHLGVLMLSEALTVGLIGGGFGVLVGIMGVFGVSAALGWRPVLDPTTIGAAVAVSMLLAAFAGIIAALLASRVTPVDALRH